ncbi:hypothetical protein SLI_6906 [Streptomyces lividans 1326]|uniref:Uncharacterized protein n=1 Tax=Streptomyces lividans 1326 TaxID=1200984 RepID=A0A7U9HG98_STRLI|nr:hypothetical protein SLI_6906 [Streptomyces lividans 1326]
MLAAHSYCWFDGDTGPRSIVLPDSAIGNPAYRSDCHHDHR